MYLVVSVCLFEDTLGGKPYIEKCFFWTSLCLITINEYCILISTMELNYIHVYDFEFNFKWKFKSGFRVQLKVFNILAN